MSYMWSTQEEHLLKILLPTNSYVEIEKEFKKRVAKALPGFRRERSAESIRKKCSREGLTPESCLPYKDENAFALRWERLQELQAEYRAEALVTRRGKIREATRKILSISDIHVPLARSELLEEVIDEHADADICVVNGDLFEGHIYSSFEKGRTISGMLEYQTAFHLVQMLQGTFPDVVLIDGNHDARAARSLKQAGLPKEATQILRPNFMARLANGEELDDTGLVIRRHHWKHVHYNPIESWYARVGKTIFAHPWNRGSSKPGYTAEKVFRYFRGRYAHEDFDSIVVGHTHKLFKGILDRTLLMEQGCFVDLLGYAHQPRSFFSSNSINGYVVIYQDDDGNTDFNLSETIYLGEVFPQKKKVL